MKRLLEKLWAEAEMFELKSVVHCFWTLIARQLARRNPLLSVAKRLIRWIVKEVMSHDMKPEDALHWFVLEPAYQF